MITTEEIRKLITLRSRDNLIISLYLRLWPDQRVHHTRVKDLIQEKLEEFEQESHPSEEKQSLEKDLKKLLEFVETVRESPHKGLVIFSSIAEDIWKVFPLAQPVRDLLVLDYSAYIRPLVRVLDEYRRVCTLLVDRTRARVFEIFMGEIEEQSEIFDEVPSKVRAAGWYGLAEKRIERHVKDHLHGHFKRVADLTFHHFQGKGFEWLLLGVQTEYLSEMESTLHSYLKQRLKRSFRMGLDAHPKQVLDRTLELMQEVKKEEDRSLVLRLKDSLKPGGLGVAGIQETLSSLYEGSVHTLLVEEGFSERGALCLKCGFMGLEVGPCPICRASMTSVPDIVEEAVASAIDQNSEAIHIIAGCGLKELGSMGAFLRYVPI